jgi:hypothetical protein
MRTELFGSGVEMTGVLERLKVRRECGQAQML